MGFAIPISDVKELIETLMNGKEDTTDASIGIQGYIISEDKQYNYPAGFYIMSIVEGSGAEKAGLSAQCLFQPAHYGAVFHRARLRGRSDGAERPAEAAFHGRCGKG